MILVWATLAVLLLAGLTVASARGGHRVGAAALAVACVVAAGVLGLLLVVAIGLSNAF